MTALSAVLSLVLLLLAKVHAQIADDAGENSAGDRRPLMRADSSAAVHLSPSGEFVEVQLHRHGGQKPGVANNASAVHSLCYQSFLLGKENTDDCKDTTNHNNIVDLNSCKFAAKQAGASIGPPDDKPCPTFPALQNFLIGEDCQGRKERPDATGKGGIYDKHPAGCFKAKDRNEFYFNDGGLNRIDKKKAKKEQSGTEAPPEGTPVCDRRRFRLGNLRENDGCPTDEADGAIYKKEMDAEECRTAGDCRWGLDDIFVVGIPPEQPNNDMKPGWMKTYDGKPSGCFYRQANATDYGKFGGKVYFNQPPNKGKQGEAPTIPKGIDKSMGDTENRGTIPICFLPRWSGDKLK